MGTGEKSTCELSAETCVRDERSKLTEYDPSETRLCETSKEVFGIGLAYSDTDEVTETTELTTKTHDDDSHGKFSLNYSSAINILDRAQLSLASFQSLVNLSESGTAISHRNFPYLNTSITLFYNSHFSLNRDTDEHDKRIDNILKSWSMSREHIAKDGDCCFRAVARNISKLTETGGLSSQAYEHLANLGLVNLDEESLSDSLRVLTVSEWLGKNRPHYESFLTTDNFDEEVKRFTHKWYFTGELGNLMVLAMANVLKMPIVIFSSLENYPTIPILPRGQLNDMPTLFVSFNAAGCGRYDYVHTETVRKVLEKQHEEQANEKKRPQVSCSFSASRKGKEKCRMFATTSLAHTLAGVSVLRLELVAMEIANAKDVQIHLGKVKLVMPRGSAYHGNDESLIFQTRSNLSQKHILMKKENRYEREH